MRPTSSFNHNESMFNKLKSMLTNGRFKSKDITWQNDDRPGCYNGSSYPFFCNNNSTYDNAFPDITRIAEAFAEVMPYAIDVNGKRLAKEPPVIRALYNPNEDMSGSEFLENLIVMMLVHPKVYILLHRYEGRELKAGGPVTKDNIAGFTFLQSPGISRVGKQITYFTVDGTYTQDDVITLSLNANPYDILKGYSPSQAAKKWATVDDYVADYQAGFFRNGAVPAGQFVVTAPTKEDFAKIVETMQAHHRGASNVNNPVYVHRPTSGIDGKPTTSQVEWVPYAQSTVEGVLQSLFDQANKKIGMNFGVPEEVKGYLQNSNYASAEVADYVFSRRVVYPKLVKVYSRLNHELNRVMGGMDCALTFDYEPPVLTDTRKIQAETLQIMLNSGFTVESAVAALQLPRSFLQLKEDAKLEEVQQVETTDVEKPSQQQKSLKSKVVATAVDPTSTTATLLSIYNLYIIQQLLADEKTNTNTENTLRTLIIASLYSKLLEREDEEERNFANQIDDYQSVIPLTTAEELRGFNLSIQEETARIQAAIEAGEELPSNLMDDSVILPTIATVDITLEKFGLQQVIESVDATNYHEQLNKLIESFVEQTVTQIQSLSDLQDLTAEERAEILQVVRDTNNYRVNRWATSEEHRAEELGTLTAAEEVTVESDLVPMKIWRAHITGNTCEHCIAINGEKVPANQPFSNGDMVPHYHPNCRCTMQIVFEEAKKSVKVSCPHCKRYMFESTGGIMKNVICANSKCKRHYNFNIKNGKISAKEVTGDYKSDK